MYEKILVPLDGSRLAEGVLGQVKGLARLTEAEICLLRVALVHPFPGVDPTEAQVKATGEAQSYLDAVADGLEREGFTVSTHVRYGREAEEILDHAREADLVAMSTHGRSGLGRWAMGSVADRVIRHSPRPVLLVRCEDSGTCAV